jgi:starch phosphorylase
MKAVRRFTVRAVLPDSLASVGALAANLRWSWHKPTRDLFRDIDADIWRALGHDPIGLLGEVAPERLNELGTDKEFVARANALKADLDQYLSEPRWYQSLTKAPAAIAYFSPEYGIAAALPQYSGGLGILAGDHLKAASDLGIPLLAIGLFYRAGYFRQAISRDGWQRESYPVSDPDGLPMRLLRAADGSPELVSLALPAGRVLRARIWVLSVGRVTQLLLDTDIHDNDDDLRGVTDRLYGGGGEHRLLQELLLGIGGVRAIKAYTRLAGHPNPEVFHTNEGHAGFLGLERIAGLIAEGLTFAEALRVIRAGTVFTTHTPVPAGIDRFPMEYIDRYFGTDLLPGVEVPDIKSLGVETEDPDMFNMAHMGLRLAQRANGVSKLHGEVSRGMFGELWPGMDTDEVPITSVTNGVHAATWTDVRMQALADRAFGSSDTTAVDWSNNAVTDADLWTVRGEMRAKLVRDARERAIASYIEENPGSPVPAWFNNLLDPNTLTIGFARRVPTYKRLTLMLSNPERLKSILTNPERPVQFVIAGKSHPADDGGKALIQRLVQFAQDPEVREHIVFLPNYDMAMARHLYPGTDVWLNNPLRPLEACGTSGMKAALNGSLNLSILDGWWNEYFDGENGWAIPTADAVGDDAARDLIEAEALYDLIEHQVAPTFYEVDKNGLPLGWLAKVRHTLATLSPELSAERMVREYVNRLYVPAANSAREFADKDYANARALAVWISNLQANWNKVHVAHVESGGAEAPQVGDNLHVRAMVEIDGINPNDLTVQVVSGRSPDDEEFAISAVAELQLESHEDGKPALYVGTIPLTRAGSFGYTVRVLPNNPLLASPLELGLVAGLAE